MEPSSATQNVSGNSALPRYFQFSALCCGFGEVEDQTFMINPVVPKRAHRFRAAFATSVVAVGLSLFPVTCRAVSYPVRGVWIADGNQLFGKKIASCAALKMLGTDAFRDQSFPEVMIFSDKKKFDVSSKREVEQNLRTAKSGRDGFHITETPGKSGKWPWSKNHSYKLKVIGPATIEITEGPTSTRFTKCSPKELAL
jgi:hypothetical protein